MKTLYDRPLLAAYWPVNARGRAHPFTGFGQERRTTPQDRDRRRWPRPIVPVALGLGKAQLNRGAQVFSGISRPTVAIQYRTHGLNNCPHRPALMTGKRS